MSVGTIDDETIFLTADHCFLGGEVLSIQIADGSRWAIGRLIDRYRKSGIDMAIVAAHCREKFEYTPLAEDNADIGDAVLLRGFVHGATMKESRETVVRPPQKLAPMATTGISLSGQSGGAIVDTQGRLVGIIWGYAGRETLATDCLNVRDFLKHHFGRMPDCGRPPNFSRPPIKVPAPKTVPEPKPKPTPEPEPRPEPEPPQTAPNPPETSPATPQAPPAVVDLSEVESKIGRLEEATRSGLKQALLIGLIGLATGGTALTLPLAARVGMGVVGLFHRRRKRPKSDGPPTVRTPLTSPQKHGKNSDFTKMADEAEAPKRDVPDEGAGCCQAPFPRELDEARELLQLRHLEGRVAPLDALVGMVVSDELAKWIEGDEPEKTKFASELKKLLDDRVNAIAPVSTPGD